VIAPAGLPQEKLIGQELMVKITTAHTNSLSGTLAEAPSHTSPHAPAEERTPA